MKLNQTLYGAFDENGNLMCSHEDIFLSTSIKSLQHEMKIWKNITWDNHTKFTIKEVKLIEVEK